MTSESEIAQALAASPFYGWMGLSLVSVEPGRVEIALDAAPHHLNIQGLLHGGVISTLADTAAGLAVKSRLESGRRHVTLHLGVNFLTAGSTGRFTATGRAVRVGRQIAYAESEVRDASGSLVATAQSTISVSTSRPSPPSPTADG